MPEEAKQPSDKPAVLAAPEAKATTRESIPLGYRRGFVYCIAEFLLLTFPLVVVTTAYLLTGKTWDQVLQSPEWAFGAAVLFGQTIMKTVYAQAQQGAGVPEASTLIIIALIVVGLMPSLIILALLLSTDKMSETLVTCQEVWFIAAAIVFLLLGPVAHVIQYQRD